MAKDTIGIGVSNVARLMDAGWIGVDNVAREIDEVWIGDENSKAQQVWKAGVDKVVGVFNGIVTCWITPTGTYQNKKMYDIDKGYSESISATTVTWTIKEVSKDGYYYMLTTGDGQEIWYYKSHGSLAQKMTPRYLASNDYITSTTSTTILTSASLYGLKFNDDNSRFCYGLLYKKTSDSDYRSFALIFWKQTSDGSFSYEKDICFFEDGVSLTSISMTISDDFSTILFKVRDTSKTYQIKIYKGNPDDGYSEIYSEVQSNSRCYLDEELGEYAVVNGSLLHISGDIVTSIGSDYAFGVLTDLYFNYDRSVMYVTGCTEASSSKRYLYCYKVTPSSMTLLGGYSTSIFNSSLSQIILGENANNEAVMIPEDYWEEYEDGSTWTSYVIRYGTLSKDTNGVITGITKIVDFTNQADDTSVKRGTTKMFSTTV